MAIRSTFVAALVIAAGLALVAASGAAVPRAHAQVTVASIFFGFISPDDDGSLPVRVRGTIGDVTCGTADVTPLRNGLGFYLLTVAPGSEKAGCGVDGAPVTFVLLAGEVDEGTSAAQTQAWAVGTRQLDLSPVPDATFGAFVGELPPGPGIGLMRWTGASATPIADAVTTIPRDIESVAYWDVISQSYRIYIPGAPSVVSDYLSVDRGDIVVIRVR